MKYRYFNSIFFISFVILICIASIKNSEMHNAMFVSADNIRSSSVIILDAGHGGEDGGAVAPDGTNEKDINLCITNDISCLFEIFGIKYIPVRTEDVSVGDNSLKSMRDRKRSDIRNREKLVNSTDNSVFFSIHQNKYGVAKYNGTQVFYGSANPDSEILAQAVQNSVVEKLQPNNTRQIKPSGDSIYLLYHAKAPAVMIECGFLSNPDELLMLKDSVYQKKFSYSVFYGLQNYLNQKELKSDVGKE